MQHLWVGSRPRFPEPEHPLTQRPPELAGCLPSGWPSGAAGTPVSLEKLCPRLLPRPHLP